MSVDRAADAGRRSEVGHTSLASNCADLSRHGGQHARRDAESGRSAKNYIIEQMPRFGTANSINTASGDAPILFSPHLVSYVDKITEQTGRKLVVERRSLPLGLKAAFIPDPRFIKIVLDPSINLKTNYAEYSIAHEVTHGLLTYAKGYAPLIAKRPLTAKEQTRRSIAAGA